MTTRSRKKPGPGGWLFRRRSRSGAELRTWWVGYYAKGRMRRESSHSADDKVARRLLRERLRAVDDGTWVGPEREQVTVIAVLDALLRNYAMRGHRSLASTTSQAKAWRDPLGARRVLTVTTDQLTRCILAWQAEHVTPATINRRLSLLRRAYRLAKLPVDPARLDFTVCFLKECSPLGRHLSPGDFAAIAARLDPGRAALFEFCYRTGKRKGQMSRTTWAHYDATAAEFTWSAAEVKGKRPEVLPLAGRPLAIVQALHATRRLTCRYVFHGPHCGVTGRRVSADHGCVGDFKRAWATACATAGYPVGRKRGGFVFHNTRHTAITNLVNEGTPAHEAMAISGHRTRSVFDRYSLSLKPQIRAALERVSGAIPVAPAAPPVVPLARARRRIKEPA
jgi:integrase